MKLHISPFLSATLALAVASTTVSGCGIQRPLVKPRDIPAYEQKQRDKIEKRQRDMDEFERHEREQQLLMPQV